MTKRETKRAKLLELWGDDEEVVSALKEEIPKELLEQIDYDEKMHQAESVLIAALEVIAAGSYESFIRKTCRSCDKPFLSTYAKVTTCSERCLKKAFADIGLTWDIARPLSDRFRPANRFPDPSQLERYKGESQAEYQGRQENYHRRLMSGKPIPLIVPSDVVPILDNLLLVHDPVQAPVSSNESI